MILQPVSDQTLCGGLSLGSQPLLYQLPGAALRGGWTLAMVLVLTHPPLYYPGSPPGVTATASPSGAPRGWPRALVSCFGRGPGSKSHQPPRGRKAATRELSLEPLLCWSHSWAPCSPVGKREHHRGGVNCGAGATRAVAEVGQRLGVRPTAFPRNRPQEPPPHRGQASLSAAQGLRLLESQHLVGEAVEAPLDGRAAAKLLQDSPDVVQVAGGSQPHGERDALWGRGPGSLTWAGGLSEGTEHLPPTSLGGHTRLSPALWGSLFMGAGGEGGVGGEVTLWSPATAASPSPGLSSPAPEQGRRVQETRKRTQL